jgi:hypothetical protein
MFAIVLVKNMEPVIGSDSCELLTVKYIQIKGLYLEGHISCTADNQRPCDHRFTRILGLTS